MAEVAVSNQEVENMSQNLTNLSRLGWNESGIMEDTNVEFYFYLWVVAAPIAFGLITFLGTLGNMLVIYVILSRRNLSTVTNFLLLNLAIADISFLLMCGPLTAYKYAAPSWGFGDFACKLWQYFLYWTTYVTVYTLVAISALRFLTVVYSNSTMAFRTKQNIIILNVVIWTLCGILNIGTAAVHEVKTFAGYSYCGMIDHAWKPFYVTFFVTGYVLPLCLICFLYVLIVCHLKKHRMPTNPAKNEKGKDRTSHVFKILLIVVLIFGLSWLPLHVQFLVALYGKLPQGAWYEVFRVLWNCFAYANSCANPFIYNYVSQEFKKAFKEVICCGRNVLDNNGNARGGNTTRYITVSNVRGDKTVTVVANNGEIGEMSKMMENHGD